jgi:hypothetical protein
MALINPDIVGYEKWVQSLMGRYAKELSHVRTEWRALTDSDGDVIAVFPCLELDFKKGSDVIEDLRKRTDTSHSGVIFVDGEAVVNTVQ